MFVCGVVIVGQPQSDPNILAASIGGGIRKSPFEGSLLREVAGVPTELRHELYGAISIPGRGAKKCEVFAQSVRADQRLFEVHIAQDELSLEVRRYADEEIAV